MAHNGDNRRNVTMGSFPHERFCKKYLENTYCNCSFRAMPLIQEKAIRYYRSYNRSGRYGFIQIGGQQIDTAFINEIEHYQYVMLAYVPVYKGTMGAFRFYGVG